VINLNQANWHVAVESQMYIEKIKISS